MEAVLVHFIEHLSFVLKEWFVTFASKVLWDHIVSGWSGFSFHLGNILVLLSLDVLFSIELGCSCEGDAMLEVGQGLSGVILTWAWVDFGVY